MNRTLLVVVLVALSFGVTVSSCGTAPARCSATTCSTGCCDLSGVCQPGSSSGACGARGNTCTACGLGASCSFGTCLGSSGAGSSGTGGGFSGTGGGTSGTGGGTSGTGGGTSGTGGGTSGTGGGTSGTGGGAAATCDLGTAPTCPVGTACVLNGAGSLAGTCLPGQCDTLTQNCSGQNKCAVGGLADGGVLRLCIPSGSLAPGASCSTANDQCQTGSQCLNISGQSLCRQFCGSSSLTCASGTLCSAIIQLGVAPGGERHLICVVPPACDALNQSTCASNRSCVFFSSGSPPGCLPFGTVPVGGTCTGSAPCERGLQCAAGVCRSFCSTTGSPGCATGSCQPTGTGTTGYCQ
ncbi:MAG: hypothetical protein JNM69_16660 [Archangium sp.]|nr:hypothetical protein [Archangium sp.]